MKKPYVIWDNIKGDVADRSKLYHTERGAKLGLHHYIDRALQRECIRTNTYDEYLIHHGWGFNVETTSDGITISGKPKHTTATIQELLDVLKVTYVITEAEFK